MSEPVRIGDATLYLGDVLTVLREMPAESVHCVVTSPPYWGLRDYGVPGQIGLEASPEEYVARMVAVFREVRRVLRSDGTAWINLGDSFATGAGSYRNPGSDVEIEHGGKQAFTKDYPRAQPNRMPIPGLKPKDLVGIPWRVAFALQADGWYLRSDIIWHKPNPMPESVKDRPTKAHEYIFLLSKSARYFYDAEAIRQGRAPEDIEFEQRYGRNECTRKFNPDRAAGDGGGKYSAGFSTGLATRNRRSVWTIATQPFPGAHFATFPEKLVEPCILAGCPEHACPKCGAPWVREVERGENTGIDGKENNRAVTFRVDAVRASGRIGETPHYTIGMHPTCACGLSAVPGTVLNPFAGSGTALVVALKKGRRAIGIELKPEYFDMACNRLRYRTVDPEEVQEAEKQGVLFG